MAENGLALQRNSTNDRTNNAGFGAVRLGFACLGAIAPTSAERLASYLFGKPKRVGISSKAEATMAAGHRFNLRVRDMTLAAWSWGNGPTILLHHGWGGRASQMYCFVSPLVEAGFSVVAYDAPAHGDSPGTVSSLPEMARVLRAAAFRLNGIYGIVGHSFGSAVSLFAIRHGLRVERAVLLAPPSDMNHFIDHFSRTVGLSPTVRSGMERSWTERYRFSWDDMDVKGWASGENPPLLVFHDRKDSRVPWVQGEEVVREWGNARLVTLAGVGHSGIREEGQVIQETRSFFSPSPTGRRAG
jgi:pimeloyl-ACP methyl ester carboxylesterase